MMLTGLVGRSSVVGLQGSATLAWLVTAGPQTPAVLAMRGPFVVLMATAMLIWQRASRPDRTVRTARLDEGLRRWGAGSQPRVTPLTHRPAAAGHERRPSDSHRATGPCAAALSLGWSVR